MSEPHYSLQPVHLDALYYLSICNRYSDTPIAVTEYLCITKGTASQTINVLVRKNLVRKTDDIHDKRKVHLELTAEGQRIVDTMTPPKLFKEALESLDKETQARLSQDLKILILALQSANQRKSFGARKSCRYNQRLESPQYMCMLTKEMLSAEDTEKICREHEAPRPA